VTEKMKTAVEAMETAFKADEESRRFQLDLWYVLQETAEQLLRRIGFAGIPERRPPVGLKEMELSCEWDIDKSGFTIRGRWQPRKGVR